MTNARILVVEDDRRWREGILRETLAKAGYAVETSSTYAEAAIRLDEVDFSLAVVDIGLSEMDDRNAEGLDVLRAIAQHHPSVPALVISGRLTPELTQHVLMDLAAKRIIEKDKFDLKEFVELVRRYALRPSSEYFVGHGFTPRQIRDLRPTVETALAQTGLFPYFADQEIEEGEHILHKVKERISESRFSIFDISLPRPNVSVEIGIAVGLNRPFLVIVKQATVVPEIMEGLVAIRYSSFRSLSEELRERIPSWNQQLAETDRSRRTYCYIQDKQCKRHNAIQNQTYLIADTRSSSAPDFRNAVIRACESSALRPVFLGQSADIGPLLCQSCEQVQTTAFGVYDICQDSAADVFLTLGLAIGFDAPYVLLIEKGTEVPSSLKGLDSFQYEAFADIEQNLADKIRGLLRTESAASDWLDEEHRNRTKG